jgi:type IV pilus assembly protein PilP
MPQNRRKKRRSRFFFIFLILILNGHLALAAEALLYKEPRPMKEIFETQKKTGEAAMPEVIIDGKKVTYFYDPTGKTDPFRSFIAKMEEVDKKKRQKPLTYLETLELSQLALIAIIVGPKGNWAMVREAKGTGHVLRKGTAIGTKGGIVHEINDRAVIIREKYKDFKGAVKYRDIAKRVPALR